MDNPIHELIGGNWIRFVNPVTSSPGLPNFLITCNYGDWSGFRTLEACESQMDELATRKRCSDFQIVERI